MGCRIACQVAGRVVSGRPGARAAGRAAAASIELWREPPPLACSDVIEASLSARLRLEIADAIPSRTFF